MSTQYLRSTDGSDSDDGSTWALAKATLVGAFGAMSAGDICYVSDAHNEATGTAITLTSPGTAAAPCKILCGDDVAEPPTTPTATAFVTTTTSADTAAFAGFAYCNGITFSISGGITFISTSPWGWTFESCALNITENNSSRAIQIGISGNNVEDDQILRLINVTMAFANVGQGIIPHCVMRMTGGSIAATGTVPTTLFAAAVGNPFDIELTGVNLAGFGSGTNLIDATAGTNGRLQLSRCKLGASVVIANGDVPGPGGIVVEAIDCHAGDVHNYNYRKAWGGYSETETTIVLTGGSTYSYKIVTTASATPQNPFYGFWHRYPDPSAGAHTLTVEIINDGVTLTNADVWLELTYKGASGFVTASLASDRVASFLSSPANQTSSSATWDTTGLSSPVTQKLEVSFTTAELGEVSWRVCVGDASRTLRYDIPKRAA